MTSFGTQIKQDQLKEVLEATGKDEYIVFCYDRYYLGASMEEIATLLDVEMPTLEPPVSPLAVSTLLNTVKAISKSATLSHHCEAYLSLFAKFDSYSQLLMKNVSSHTLLAKTMVEEQKAQSMALNVAVTNLETHIQITNQGVQEFYLKAEKELDKQSALLDTTDIDLDILRSIQIHPEFIDHTNNYNAMENVISLEGKTSLMDFVDMDQLQTARQDTQELCQNLANDIQFLRSVVMELKEYEDDLRQQIAIDHDLQTLDTMLMDIQEIRDKAQFLRDKIKRDLNRIYIKIADLLQVPLSSLFATLSLDGSTNASTTFPSQSKKTLEAFYHLAEIHVNDYLSKLNSYEAIVRQHINKLSQLKRQSIQKFLKNMNTVSQLQSDIAATSPRLDSANKSLMDFKSRYGTSYLETSRDMLFAYGALMIEVLRRKEYASILVENANLIADILGRFREQEEERRNFFRHDIENTLPFKITTINEAAPQFEISTINTYDSKSLITKKDIIDFVSLLDRSYSQAMGNQMNPGTNRPSSKNAKNDRKGSFST
ncbi:uncharacterized protein BX664DRAFT_267274 [Halteromyces radiatus]|uniref:uncharacterized protein n=1 Tax=Halteromyces radiatus TaxID=101107 RepID=UPI0022211D85|nr:uncharacterized protein BX664DRAFT_267274 [Halteromyces radiatus]KAI8084748.1 hypothetical protein BX664DRAFT_267274 [Halteromyces radiatus]